MVTVLLAEHHRATLEHLAAALGQAGFRVSPVGVPAEAIERYSADRPTVVVVAVDFPRLGGAHLGTLIRGREGGASVPIVAIDKAHLGKARGLTAVLDLRVNAYVADPTKTNELVARLHQLSKAPTRAPTDGIAATLRRQAVVTGELRDLGLPEFWHSAFRLERDGILVVALRELSRRVFFLKGRPVGYDSTARQDGFPMFLVERKKLTDLEAPISLTGEDLLQELRDYTREKSAQVIGMREGRFAFYGGKEFAKDLSPVELAALGPLLEGARRSFPVKVFARELKSHGAAYPVRSPRFAADLPALGLSNQDLKHAMQVNGRIRLDELIAHGRSDLSQAYSLFWFLKRVGAIELRATPLAADPHSPASADRIGPRRRKPLPAKTADALREGALKIITASYFRGLGLGIDADGAAVKRAYQETAARFHPDSYAEFDLSELKDLLDSVQDRLLASYRVLSVDTKRHAYLQFLFSKGQSGRAGQINVESEIALKRGEAALKRGDLLSAVTAFQDAVAFNPREPEYYSYLAWATFRSGGGSAAQRGKEALKLLRKALGLNPHLHRANVIHAIIDAELGDASGARKRLLKVLELDPGSQLARAALRKVGR